MAYKYTSMILFVFWACHDLLKLAFHRSSTKFRPKVIIARVLEYLQSSFITFERGQSFSVSIKVNKYTCSLPSPVGWQKYDHKIINICVYITIICICIMVFCLIFKVFKWNTPKVKHCVHWNASLYKCDSFIIYNWYYAIKELVQTYPHNFYLNQVSISFLIYYLLHC